MENKNSHNDFSNLTFEDIINRNFKKEETKENEIVHKEEKPQVVELNFEEIVRKNKEEEKEEPVTEKPQIKNFNFDEIVSKSKKVKEKSEEKSQVANFNFDKIVTKGKKNITSNKKIKHKRNTFKYHKYEFRNLADITSFLLLEYKNKEKHAQILLNNQEFLEWLESKIADKDVYKNWVENVLS